MLVVVSTYIGLDVLSMHARMPPLLLAHRRSLVRCPMHAHAPHTKMATAG